MLVYFRLCNIYTTVFRVKRLNNRTAMRGTVYQFNSENRGHDCIVVEFLDL